jgi:hypothetical protein
MRSHFHNLWNAVMIGENFVTKYASRLNQATENFKGATISYDKAIKEGEQCIMEVAEAKQVQNNDELGEYTYRVQVNIVEFRLNH